MYRKKLGLLVLSWWGILFPFCALVQSQVPADQPVRRMDPNSTLAHEQLLEKAAWATRGVARISRRTAAARNIDTQLRG